MKQVNTVEKVQEYSSIFVIPGENQEKEDSLKEFMKSHEIKSKYCQQYVVKDQQSLQVLGLAGKEPGIYLLSALNQNVLPEARKSMKTFKIG